MKLTNALLGEHGAINALFARSEQLLESTTSLDAARSVVECLAAVVASHAKLEDDLLFPTLEPHLPHQGPLGVMRREHEQIEMALDDALNAADVPAVREAVHEVIELCRSHFAKEENVLFPMAEQFVPATILNEICQGWANRREVAVTI